MELKIRRDLDGSPGVVKVVDSTPQSPFSADAALSKDPDRSYLADAIHFVDLIHLADEELPPAIATVARSKAAAVRAQVELDKHQQWMRQHQELYSQALKECERCLKRQAFIAACKHRALLPMRILATACLGLSHAAWAYPRRRWLRAKLRNRIQAVDQSREPQVTPHLQQRIQAIGRLGGKK